MFGTLLLFLNCSMHRFDVFYGGILHSLEKEIILLCFSELTRSFFTKKNNSAQFF